MADPTYTPPKIWNPETVSGGRFAGINRPTAGSREHKALPEGDNPFPALFARHAQRCEGDGDAGGIARSRPCGGRIRRLHHQYRRWRAVHQRLLSRPTPTPRFPR